MPAMEIKASDVQKLRQMTGAGLMDCKRALNESGGDFDKAIQFLREQGIAKSAKRADRAAAEGIVEAWVSPDQKQGIILELNSETDFVARNEEFLAMAKTLIEKVRTSNATSADQVAKEDILALSGKTGEKIEFRRFAKLTIPQEGIVAAYIHPGAKLGVLVEIQANKNVAGNAALKDLGKEICIQVAGANPLYVNRSEVPQETLEKEKDIYKKQLEGQKKPPEILEKIATGKLQQFYEAQVLLDQPHVRDVSGKTRIQDLIDGVARKEGVEIKVTKFVRFRVGAE